MTSRNAEKGPDRSARAFFVAGSPRRNPECLAPLAQAQRILNNDAVWSAIYFPATGRRNGYQDQINAAQDAASVPQGPWEF
jgi:hypothetical protein